MTVSSAAVVTVLDGLGRLGGVTIDPGAGDVVPGVEHAPGTKQPALVIVTRVFDVKYGAASIASTKFATLGKFSVAITGPPGWQDSKPGCCAV